MTNFRSTVFSSILWSILLTLAWAYEVPLIDSDTSRQVCSGMWADEHTYIKVTFDSVTRGLLAMVIYEWSDVKYLGKVTSHSDLGLPKTFVCSTNAVNGGYCSSDNLGSFILDLPSEKSISDTSFWSARVSFDGGQGGLLSSTLSSKGLWDNPAGDLTPPPSIYDSPWRRGRGIGRRQSASPLNPSPVGTLNYSSPIVYQVRKTGYYCVATIPFTVVSPTRAEKSPHPTYHGSVLFKNAFNGMLPATDYPKVNFYFAMFIVYIILASAWAWLCWKHQNDLSPIQNYVSLLFGLLIIELAANWAYYRYLNAHGKGTPSTVFLFVVAILDAGRNALSFFLLLIVSLGLSVVRESLGRMMFRCQALAAAHFIFGVLYAVGIVELELESTSALILLLFVIPLAFTLSSFLMWILYALNGTISQLRARKQRYKLTMFERLYRILVGAAVVILIFFVVSSFSFTGRLAEDYAAKSWKLRWWLLDGWLALLYFAGFSATAYLWRPSENNRRLAMSDELAQDEEDAEDYDLDTIESRTRHEEGDDGDDDRTLVGHPSRPARVVGEDQVVFDIGEEEDDEHDPSTARRRKDDRSSEEARRVSGERNEEREGLMTNDGN